MGSLAFYSPTHVLIAERILHGIPHALRIVDYGCGEGELLRYIPSSRMRSYLGFEVSKNSITVAQKEWGTDQKIHFRVIDRKKLPIFGTANSLDVVVLIGVVQYLPEKDLRHVLTEAHRALKPGGKVLISCTTDHSLYKWLNIYRLFLPHVSVNRKNLLKKIAKNGFQIKKQYERGILLTPLFSNVFVFFFDALDKMVYRTQGNLGPLGRGVRNLWSPLIQREFQITIDYGYTLFIEAVK